MGFKQGDIVWALIAPKRGIPKRRPAVIYTPTWQIDIADKIGIVGISTSFREDERTIPIPWSPRGDACTKLTKQSAICLDLIMTVDKTSVSSSGGYVGPAALIQLIEKLKQLSINLPENPR